MCLKCDLNQSREALFIMSLIEAQAGMTDLIPCNDQCGGDYPLYRFTQNDSEVVVFVPVPAGTTGKQVRVDISTNTVHISLRGQPPVVVGDLYKPIKADDSTWSLEDKCLIVVTLAKSNLKFEEWWPHIVTSERQIDMKTLKPPSKHLRELDAGTQSTVAKMMFDQDQKRKGLPTSEELKVEELMKKAGVPS
jgi:hypothetical protein